MGILFLYQLYSYKKGNTEYAFAYYLSSNLTKNPSECRCFAAMLGWDKKHTESGNTPFSYGFIRRISPALIRPVSD